MPYSLEELTTIFRKASAEHKRSGDPQAFKVARTAALQIKQLKAQGAPAPQGDPGTEPAPQQYPVVMGVEESGFTDTLKEIGSAVKEKFTGNERKTPETEKLPDWGDMPEMNSQTEAGYKTAAAWVLGGADDAVQAMKAGFGGVEAKKDAKGNYLLKSSIDGNWYAVKPGFQWKTDVPAAVGQMAAYAGLGKVTGGAAGLAGKAASRAGQSALSHNVVAAGRAALGALENAGQQTVVEGVTEAVGGTANPENIAGAAAIGGAAPALQSGIKEATGAAGRALRSLRGKTAQQIVAEAPEQISLEELTGLVREASTGGMLARGKAAQKLAAYMAKTADPRYHEAVKALTEAAPGVADDLARFPEASSSSDMVRASLYGVRSVPGAASAEVKEEALKKAATSIKNDLFVRKLNATSDLEVQGQIVRSGLESVDDEFKGAANESFGKIRKAIELKDADTSSVISYLQEEAKRLRGINNLDETQKKFLSKFATVDDNGQLQPKSVSYAFLDKERMLWNEQRAGAGEYATASDHVKNAITAALREDSMLTAQRYGLREELESAFAATTRYKDAEKQMSNLFGKHLDASFSRKQQAGLSAAQNGRAADLDKFMSNIPDDMRGQVASSGLLHWAEKGADEGKFNWARLKDVRLLFDRNPTTKQAIYKYLGQSDKRAMDALLDVADGVASAKEKAIATGRIAEVRELLAAGKQGFATRMLQAVISKGGPAAAAGGAAAAGAPGVLVAALSWILSHSPGKDKAAILSATDAFVSSKKFTNLVAAYTQARFESPALAQAVRVVADSPEFARFAASAGIQNRRDWVMATMQSVRQQLQDSANDVPVDKVAADENPDLQTFSMRGR